MVPPMPNNDQQCSAMVSYAPTQKTVPRIGRIILTVNRASKYSDQLSNRQIELDANGYFLIKIERLTNELILEHYLNNIDQKGRAIDPESGEPISCKTKSKNQPKNIIL